MGEGQLGQSQIGGEDSRSLYEKVRDVEAQTPEEQEIYDGLYAETFQNLLTKFGPEKASSEMTAYLRKTVVDKLGLNELIQHEEAVRSRIAELTEKNLAHMPEEQGIRPPEEEK